jgi:tetratricopeptide (TPR) repeat protein
LFNFKNPAYTSRQRFVAFAAVALLLLGIGLAVNNEHRRQHRTLHVFNAFAQPAKVQIDGVETSVEPGQMQVPISEGHHQAKITGPIEQQIDFDVESGYFARWFKDPVWVLNIGGAAILNDSTIIYAVNPPPAAQRLIVGEPFTYRPHVDYVFVAPPPRLQIEGHAQQVTKTHLDWLHQEPSAAFSLLAPKVPDVALAFAESQLTANPADAFLLEHYIEFGADRGQSDRLEKFLKAGCSRRPIVVEWHRCYQDLLQRSGRQPQVVEEYDALLKAEPQNGRLLYLRGRIDPDHVHSHDFYLRATKAESDFAWPWYAMGGQAYEEGDWRDALQLFERAAERGFDVRILAPMRHVARLAIGDAAKLEAEYREQLTAKPYDGTALWQLCDTLAFQGKADDARTAFSEWEGRLSPLPADEMAGEIASMRMMMLYQIGDLDGIRTAIDSLGESSFAELRARMMIAAHQLDEAARDERLAKAWNDPATALELSIGYSIAGNDKEATKWRDRACKSLEHRSPEELRAAQFLRADSAPPVEEVMKASVFRPGKPLLLAALAMRFPESRASYGAAAAKLNVSRNPPYLTVKEAFSRKMAENPSGK